jgi:putative endopeptidase
MRLVILAAALVPRLAAAAPAAPAAPIPAERPLTSLPYTPGLDPAAMDRSKDPCVDFFAYTCGGWVKANPIPPDQASWSVYAKLADENRQLLWGLLEQAGRGGPTRTPSEVKIGDYFASCMDEAAVDRAAATPLAKDLAAIAALRSKRELPALVGRLQPGLEDGLVFGLGSEQDAKDATQVIATLAAGGLGLPDRDYYLKDDARSEEIRKRYATYVADVLRLAGDAPAAAEEGAASVVRLETALAKATLSRVEKRDPYRVYHRMAPAQVQALAPALRFDELRAASGAPRFRVVNVTEPAFLVEVETRLEEEPLATWRSYLRFHLADARAPYLSRAFQEAHFAFHGAFLQGVKEERPRWKRCVAWVDRDLGEALGKVFVAKAFPAEVKPEVTRMTEGIQRAMERRLRDLPWMTEPTKRAALEKLAAVRNKIGYPARWRDYGKLAVDRRDFAGNVERALRFETARQLAKIGRPVDRDEWSMTPPTVNAYYDEHMNDINFPAGVLLPPLYDPRMDAAPGYGNTGGTIGHELTHGFDDEGRQFDAWGNLRDWWTPADARAFEERASCVVAQYGEYPVVGDVKVNSRLTIGEDVADLGGTILAYLAWKEATRGERLEAKDGLTPEQRFFVGYAQWACEDEREESKRVRAVTNPHSPGVWRVNGVVANLPEFREAFQCKAGQPMAREVPCRVW